MTDIDKAVESFGLLLSRKLPQNEYDLKLSMTDVEFAALIEILSVLQGKAGQLCHGEDALDLQHIEAFDKLVSHVKSMQNSD